MIDIVAPVVCGSLIVHVNYVPIPCHLRGPINVGFVMYRKQGFVHVVFATKIASLWFSVQLILLFEGCFS